jgi:hypothetical protein
MYIQNCGSRMFYPGSRIRIWPLLHSGSGSRELQSTGSRTPDSNFYTQAIKSFVNLSRIPDPTIAPSLIPDPGIKSSGSRIPDPDPQHSVHQYINRFVGCEARFILDSQLPLEDPTPPSPSCFVRASRLSLKRKNPFYLTQSKQLQPALSLSVECVTTTATPSQQGIPGLVVFYVYDSVADPGSGIRCLLTPRIRNTGVWYLYC